MQNMSISTDRRDVVMRFVLGGLSNATSSAAVHPMDTIKIRLQLDNELSCSKNIFKGRYYKGIFRGGYRMMCEEGIRVIYRGLAPSMIRELSYSSIRAGSYEPLKRLFGGLDRHNTDFATKLMAGAGAGLLGSAFTTPTDICKVRLQADGIKNRPREYRGTLHCFQQVWVTQGFKGLFAGATPNMARAVLLTSMQFPVYDHSKHTILNAGWLNEGLLLHLISAMIAGLAASVLANPADLIKTRIMNHKRQDFRYTSPMDVLIKTIKSEGILGLFKGVSASWLRLGPGIAISFTVFEQLRFLCNVDPI